MDGYLADAVEEQEEATNCGGTSHSWHDWHVWLVETEAEAVMPPRFSFGAYVLVIDSAISKKSSQMQEGPRRIPRPFVMTTARSSR